jgi:lysophospholipase L1-like esterase
MDGRASAETIGSFAALGDSFTEGLNDRLTGDNFHGWADRFADRLAAHQPGLRYANLAVRGKLLGEVAAEQVPRAVEMAPDLVSIAAGGNDILRPGTDPDALAEVFDDCVASLRAAGCRVLLFTGFDPSAFPVIRMLRGKVAAYNMHLRTIAAARDCDLVDLWSMRILRDRRVWSADRLHLTAEGHQRVALFVCERVGVPVTENWRDPLPDVPRPGQIPRPVASAAAVAAAEASAVSLAVTRLGTRLRIAREASDRSLAWMNARGQDTRWAVEYAMPWVRRRLTGRSSGDEVPPKRPELVPLEALGRFRGPEASESA